MRNIIVFTGGGTAGHVLPNFPIISRFLENNWEVHYIGSKDGMEKNLIERNFPNIKYHGITCDKMRRYVTYKHLFVPFKLGYGLLEAFLLLKKLKPRVLFSKGGFVSVPASIASWFLKIPIIAHESDYSVGLANKLIFPLAKLIAVSFEKSHYGKRYQNKMFQVGPLTRKAFFNNECPANINICFPDPNKKTILIMGGSTGAKNINLLVYNYLFELIEKFNIIHICGKGNIRENLQSAHYFVFEYLDDGLQYLLKISDLIISRAGANSIWEILLTGKPNILLPLSVQQSRGDQIENARYFEKLGVSRVLQEENLTFESLIHEIEEIFNNYEIYLHDIKRLDLTLGDEILYKKILSKIG